jgi:two-component system sensor histidine kinase PhoQ
MAKLFAVNSLRRRILVATYGTILFFLLLAGVALDNAFQRVIRSNIKDKLQNFTFSLLASARLDRFGHLTIPQHLLPNDVKIPKSGLIALVIDENGAIEWRSPSSLGENLPLFTSVKPGTTDFESNKRDFEQPFVYRFGTIWGNGQYTDKLFTFVVVEHKDAYFKQIKDYRETIIQWLGGGSLLILLVHGILLLRELRPLKRVVSEIDAIEKGSSDHISGQYPSELDLLTRRINQFIHNEREQLARYRHALDDLAHSLKTPLAVIRGLQQEGKSEQSHSQLLNEQLARMTDIIDYQLKRAASAGGRNTLGANQIPLRPILDKTLSSLDKVYADKQIQHQITCDETLMFLGDKDDLYEIIGNISDNAYKWANNTISIDCAIKQDRDTQWLTITIQDDGTGFSLASEQQITQRGVRADEQVPGQGIGLAVVQNIVRSYGGKLRTDKSNLGGALIELSFPA